MLEHSFLPASMQETEPTVKSKQNFRWTIPAECSYQTIPDHSCPYPHHLIFHEIFSGYYQVTAAVLEELMKMDYLTYASFDTVPEGARRKKMLELIHHAMQSCSRNGIHFSTDFQEKDVLDVLFPEENPVEETHGLLADGFVLRSSSAAYQGYSQVNVWTHQLNPAQKKLSQSSPIIKGMRALESIYQTDQESEAMDLIPLTTAEKRWLQTILKDEKAELFFEPEEIAMLRQILGDSVPDFDMDQIVFFDSLQPHAVFPQKKILLLRTILQAISEARQLSVTYETATGKRQTFAFCFIILEYAKRDDVFRAYGKRPGDDRIAILNLNRIKSVSPTPWTYDHKQLLTALKKHQLTGDTPSFVTVMFRNERNTADRILYEMSPWRKECTYDTEHGMYTMTIFYSPADESELIIRLMSYGVLISFADPAHPISREILRRLKRQL